MSIQIAVHELNPHKIASAIHAGWEKFLLGNQYTPTKRANVYASSFRECLRRMVLEMVEGDKLPIFEADTLANFRRGNDRERNLLADLSLIGRDCEPEFAVEGQQERFELMGKSGKVVMTGKVDARLRFSRFQSAPLEVKAWSPNTVARIHRFEDLFENRWTKSGAYQLLAYLLGAGEPMGFLLLDRHGIPLLIPVELYSNIERIEDFLARAELAMQHKEEGTLPDFIDDPEECKHCPFFGSVCNPPLKHEGAKIVTDPEFIQILERREEVKAAADEFSDLDKEVKKALRGVESAIAGPFQIQGRWGKQTKVQVPKEIKEQYTTVDPKGRFTVKITKLG